MTSSATATASQPVFVMNRNYFDLCALSVGYQKVRLESIQTDLRVYSYVKGSKIFQCTIKVSSQDYHVIYAKQREGGWKRLESQAEVFEYMYTTPMRNRWPLEFQGDSGGK